MKEVCVGDIFGKWIVIDNVVVDKKVKCRCMCGTERLVLINNLLGGYSKCCGCWRIGNKNGFSKKYNRYIFDEKCVIGITENNDEFYIDKEDYDLIKPYCWHKTKWGYFRTKINGHGVFMHKFLLGLPNNNVVEIDHINGKRFDNRRSNLRKISHLDNMKNLKIYSTNKSGIKGVIYRNDFKKWVCELQHNKQRISIMYSNKEDAIKKRKELEEIYFNQYNRREEDLNNGADTE